MSNFHSRHSIYVLEFKRILRVSVLEKRLGVTACANYSWTFFPLYTKFRFFGNAIVWRKNTALMLKHVSKKGNVTKKLVEV